MVSQDSPSNSNSSNILHQFIISNSIPNQNHHQFENPHFENAYPNIPYTNSLPLNLSSEDSEMSNERRLMDLLGTSNHHHTAQQRLSLSLSSSNIPCRQLQRPFNSSLPNHGYFNSGMNTMNDYPFSGTAYGAESFVAAIGNSKYLKPAQSLLQEMVSVGGSDIDATNQKLVQKLSRKRSFGLSSDLKMELSNTNHGNYISLLKLLALLEEVERRYEEYYHHMEDLVSSFEMIAGLGAGKSYTALALQAMSKHFCTLRSAIVSRVRAMKKKIESEAPKIGSRLAQLSLFDQECSRQNNNRVSVLQQIGIMHTGSRQAWRPIRGLPETSVTILRAWLFEHFLHPYPSDSEKLILASQTGLSKNQVSNWFINARVRLWKPMIEEMYKEEFAESSTESDQLLTREGVGDSAEDFE